jgi:hypothetical protein
MFFTKIMQIKLLNFLIIGAAVAGISFVSNIASPDWDIQAVIQLEYRYNGTNGTQEVFLSVTDPATGNSVAPDTFNVSDDWTIGFFDSSKVRGVAGANEGKFCSVKGKGWRFGLFSLKPTVTEIFDCQQVFP